MVSVTRLVPGAVLFCFLICSGVQAQQTTLSSEQQIRAAVSAAPPGMQEGAKVLGYDAEGRLVTLRDAQNELVCLADDPQRQGFHVACYYQDLEPFMSRGRELREMGKSRSEVDSMRQAEIESGQIKWPEKPMGLYSLSGPEEGFDFQTGTIREAKRLYVVYVPYATERSTGISTVPAGEGGSWLMDPGLPWAHIMIPGRPQKESSE